MEQETAAFESWAIVELMGHRKIAGKVTEKIIAGVPLLRIDVPAVGESKGLTQFYGAQSIYCLTPTTEEICKRFAAMRHEEPVSAYELKSLPAPSLYVPTDDEQGEDDEPLSERI